MFTGSFIRNKFGNIQCILRSMVLEDLFDTFFEFYNIHILLHVFRGFYGTTQSFLYNK